MASAIMMLSLRVAPKDEAAFTEFYHHRYIPRLLEVAPEIVSARRYEEWGVEGSLAWFRKRFLTVYELVADDPVAAVADALARPGREAEKAEWAAFLESGAVKDVERHVYVERFAHPRRTVDGAFGGRPFFMVSVETNPAETARFDVWYETDYLPKTLADIPTFAACRRYRSLDRDVERVHTVYEANDEAALIRSFQLLRAPWRYGSNAAWEAHVGHAIRWQDAAGWRPIYRRPG